MIMQAHCIEAKTLAKLQTALNKALKEWKDHTIKDVKIAAGPK